MSATVGTTSVSLRRFAVTVADRLQALLFSLKTFAAAILALVISYWLELRDPQWAVLTAYLCAQPLVGAVWAKGAYRIVGTVAGAAFAVICVALLAQAGPLFILVMALWLGACAFGATLTRNYASYGFALAAFSGPLIGFESMAMPDRVWSLAADRVTEVGLGIVCVGVIHAVVLPRYAGDALTDALASTFAGLARYAAVTLRPGTPDSLFTDMRHRMSADVIKFDALRSYAAFQSPELRRDEAALSRVVRAFLGLLSVARGLHIRLEDLRRHEDAAMARLLDPVLVHVADLFAAIADDPGGPRSAAVDAALREARRVVGDAQGRLEALVGSAPTEPLANGLLALHRTGDMIESLSRVVVAVRGPAPAEAAEPPTLAVLERDLGAALVQAVRAATALVVVGAYWIASAWTAGVPAITGLAIVMAVFVTANNQGRMAANFMIGAFLAMIVALFVKAFVVPQLGDFVPFAAMLGLVLIPAGIVMSNPTWGFVATAFSAFFATQVGLTNVPSFDTATYIDSSIGMLLGLAAGVLAIDLVLPYDPARMRRREWQEVVAALPAAARGERPEIAARRPILLALLKLMPRLDFTQPADDEVMNGSFGAASMSLELVRLHDRAARPTFPVEACGVVAACLDALALAFERLVPAAAAKDRARIVDEAVAAVAAARAALDGPPVVNGRVVGATGPIEVTHALASLRFIADRLDIDRAFLTQTIRGAYA
jgi:uncharacterized membrane protein YccC